MPASKAIASSSSARSASARSPKPALQDRTALRTRFKLPGKVALVEVAGLGAELTGQLSLQLSLLDAARRSRSCSMPASDADAAAVLRRQVPALGLRASCSARRADAALLWRAADVIVARPRPEVISRVMLVGGKLVALIDDSVAERRRASRPRSRRASARSPRRACSCCRARSTPRSAAHRRAATEDGADHIADIVAAVAGDKRGVIDERRDAAQAATRDRVRTATPPRSAAARRPRRCRASSRISAAAAAAFADAVADLPDKAELERLRAEVARASSS